MSEFDLVIRGGAVVDGTGAPSFAADVATSGGKIVAVGKIGGHGTQEIDARGLMVTPGFVDIHTHYDGQATWDSYLQPSALHGVTSVVMGNCGVGFAPVKKQDRNKLIELMEGIEDIPEAVLHQGLEWNWESFEDYMDVVDSKPHDIDVAAQLPHAALRVYVMGERAMRLESATPDDVAQMRKLTESAVRAGAIGFSTSRSLNHQTLKGENTPGLKALEDELTGLALGLKDAGRGVIELLSDFDAPDIATEFALLRRVVERSGRPMSFSAIGSRPGVWRQQAELLNAAVNETGVPMRLQVPPRSVGMLFNLDGTLHPFMFSPSFTAIAHKTLAEKVTIMRDPSFRAKLLAEEPVAQGPDGRPLTFLRSRMLKFCRNFDRVFRMGNDSDYEPREEDSFAAIAKSKGVSPLELVYDALLENEGKTFMYFLTGSYDRFNLDEYHAMLAEPHGLIGLGDGGAHVSFICDASFPTFLLSYWGRDRARDKFDIPWLVRRLTSGSAHAVGMLDRGVIAPGMKADLNVIDFDNLGSNMPTMLYDLPAGGKRLLQKANGYEATIVSGEVTYRKGEATGKLPGRLVRNFS